MNKKRFDKKLYAEGLRQLRVLGIVFLGISALVAVLNSVGSWISLLSIGQEELKGTLPVMVSASDMMPFIQLSFLLFAPILSLKMFHFLTDRKSSDFYHSIPQTRACVFLSFFAAIVSWLLMIVLGQAAAAALSRIVFPGFFRFSAAELLRSCLSAAAAGFYTAAAAAIACSITGTAFSNVIVTGLLIFAPRLILSAIVGSVSSACYVMVPEKLSFFFNNDYNLVVRMLSNFLSQRGTTAFSWGPVLYTAVLGALFVLAALLFYRKRRSEAAGFAAPNALLGAVYRLTIAFIICLIPISLIFGSIVKGTKLDVMDRFEIFVLYLIAVIAFYLYELIMTRKLAMLKKATLSLLLLPLLNVLAIVLMVTAYRSTIRFRPAADEIRAISVYDNTDTAYFLGQSEENYFEAQAEKLLITEPAAVKAAADGLAQTLDELDEINQGHYRGDRYSLTIGYKTQTGKTVYREVRVSEAQYDTILKGMRALSEYKEIYTKLPDDSATLSLALYAGKMDAAARSRLYEALRRDAAAMDFDSWIGILRGEIFSIDTLHVTKTENGTTSSFNVPITPELPETFRVYGQELQTDNAKQIEELLASVKRVESVRLSAAVPMDTYMVSASLQGSVFSAGSGEALQFQQTYQIGSSWYPNEETAHALLDILEKSKDNDLTGGRIYLLLGASTELWGVEAYNEYGYWEQILVAVDTDLTPEEFAQQFLWGKKR
ncbi:MAG: hypothetical protein II882_08165 [Lachnospiraceae bacterium]|nr:hypothetical protein [Lachnospiraceae bacterium]